MTVPKFRVSNISLQVVDGDRFLYAVPVTGGGELELVKGPAGAVLREGRVEWLAEGEGREEMVISARNRCEEGGSREEMRLSLEVVRCQCENDGWCVRDRGQFVCQCPAGFSGRIYGGCRWAEAPSVVNVCRGAICG